MQELSASFAGGLKALDEGWIAMDNRGRQTWTSCIALVHPTAECDFVLGCFLLGLHFVLLSISMKLHVAGQALSLGGQGSLP